jgi:hypothetical protein
VKDETTVPDVKNQFKQVLEEPERMFEMLEIDIKRQAERAVAELMKAELTAILGRGRYERESDGDAEEQPNYRNGSYHRTFATQAPGELDQREKPTGGRFRTVGCDCATPSLTNVATGMLSHAVLFAWQ